MLSRNVDDPGDPVDPLVGLSVGDTVWVVSAYVSDMNFPPDTARYTVGETLLIAAGPALIATAAEGGRVRYYPRDRVFRSRAAAEAFTAGRDPNTDPRLLAWVAEVRTERGLPAGPIERIGGVVGNWKAINRVDFRE